MSEVVVTISISADEYIKHYQGTGRSVYTHTAEGRTVRFPANILQPYVTRNGIFGTFKIIFSKSNKFQSIKKLNR